MTDVFEGVGFRWDRDREPDVPSAPTNVERVLWRYLRSLPQFVWNAAQLEGNPFTYPEVQTARAPNG